jgi:hypothetical protein
MFMPSVGEESDNLQNENNFTRIFMKPEGEVFAKFTSGMDSLRMLMLAIGEGSDNLQNENNVSRIFMKQKGEPTVELQIGTDSLRMSTTKRKRRGELQEGNIQWECLQIAEENSETETKMEWIRWRHL